MRSVIALLLLTLSLVACRSDDPMRAYEDPDRVWSLKELDGAPFPATATMRFPKTGQIVGQGPCNRYFGAMTAQYPLFDAGPIGSTRMACPTGTAETAFLAALEVMYRARVEGDALILTSPDGREMVFKATD